MKIVDMETKELKNLMLGLHDSIYISQCYSTKDWIMLEAGVEELEKRGFTVDFSSINLSIYKE